MCHDHYKLHSAVGVYQIFSIETDRPDILRLLYLLDCRPEHHYESGDHQPGTPVEYECCGVGVMSTVFDILELAHLGQTVGIVEMNEGRKAISSPRCEYSGSIMGSWNYDLWEYRLQYSESYVNVKPTNAGGRIIPSHILIGVPRLVVEDFDRLGRHLKATEATLYSLKVLDQARTTRHSYTHS